MNLSNIDPAALSQALDDYDPDREHFLDLTDGSFWTFVFSESTDETRKKYDDVRLKIGTTCPVRWSFSRRLIRPR